MIKLRFYPMWLIAALLIFGQMQCYSLQNNVGAHDPSSIIKCGNTYWIFTTGIGIYTMYSTDLIKWTAGPTPFTQTNWPEWISSYVPDFEGHFWAPECVFMNGKYYLYYSCSTWGVKISAIGLVSNRTLDPSSPEYEWIDEGVVVNSNESSDANCIDPSLFRDKDDRLWLSYGSYFGGIRFAELNPVNGMPLNTERTAVASGDCEASYVINHNSYYYLFINRGTCCQGVNSTYHIQVGRSENPTGPFLDKNGLDLNSGQGTTILSTSDNFIGPGCFGYFAENGTEYATYHYYDGNVNGMATLAIANLRWDADEWPIITSEWISDGIYSIASEGNYYVWQSEYCEGSENEAIIQGYYSHDTCQQWQLTNLGNGYYRIGTPLREMAVVLEDCIASSGTPLILGPYNEQACEIWRIERTYLGSFTIASKYGNRIAAIPEEDNTTIDRIELADYTGTSFQRWVISDTSANITSLNKPLIDNSPNFSVYPNPFNNGTLVIDTGVLTVNKLLAIYSSDGRTVYETILSSSSPITKFDPSLPPGLYWLGFRGTSLWKKIMIL